MAIVDPEMSAADIANKLRSIAQAIDAGAAVPRTLSLTVSDTSDSIRLRTVHIVYWRTDETHDRQY